MNATSPPLPLAYWEALRRLVEPFELMKFTLIFDGQLPAGQSRRASYAAEIRNKLHPQMRDLWDTHIIMRQLAHEGRVNKQRMGDLALKMSGPTLPDYAGPAPPLKEHEMDLCDPITVPGFGACLPIVRNSFYLACAVDILFLRYEEPFRLFEQGGDIDNRLKCFFDALTIPKPEQAERGVGPCADPLCCLLENDHLISDFSIHTGRLLGKCDKGASDVRIQADITIKVLRVMDQNQCLIGG
jgi:hypothetical protein